MVSEVMVWKRIRDRIEEEVQRDGEMQMGGLCAYIDGAGYSPEQQARMKARLLTARYNESNLCNVYRWGPYRHEPRLRFIARVLAELERTPPTTKIIRKK